MPEAKALDDVKHLIPNNVENVHSGIRQLQFLKGKYGVSSTIGNLQPHEIQELAAISLQTMDEKTALDDAIDTALELAEIHISRDKRLHIKSLLLGKKSA